MKILLIRPPYTRLKGAGQAPYFPLGLGYIAAVLDEAGYAVNIYHAENPRSEKDLMLWDADVMFELRSESYHRYINSLSDKNHHVWQEVLETLRSHKPDVVGISALSVEIGSAIKIADLCKEYDPNCKVVLGGLHPTFMADSCIENESVDFIVRGEGEYSMLELCRAIEKGGNNYRSVAGISYSEEGKVTHNPPRALIADLDELPFPARHLILYPESFQHKSFGSLITARGCPWRCTFCSSRNFWDKKLRFRSTENLVAEIESIRKDYDTSYFMFWDDAFTIHHKVISKYCDEFIKRKLKITWRTATRADLLSNEMLKLLSKAGCVRLDIGVETGSKRMSEIIKKDITMKQVVEAFKIIGKNNIAAGAFFMTGFPHETKEDMYETLNLMKEIRPSDIAFNVFDPMPGSEDYDTAIKMNLVPENPDWNRFPFWPDAHYVKDVSPEDFTRIVNEIGKWVFDYNNSLSTRIRRMQPAVLSLLKNDPVFLVQKIAQALMRRLRANFFRKKISSQASSLK